MLQDKPFTLQLNFKLSQDAISELFSQLTAFATANPNLVREFQITQLLRQLGIPSHIRGYQYLKDAIFITLEKQEAIYTITKSVYPEIAFRNHTTAVRVERAIRHAIDTAYANGNSSVFNFLFKTSPDDSLHKPTNAEFIAVLANYLRLFLTM